MLTNNNYRRVGMRGVGAYYFRRDEIIIRVTTNGFTKCNYKNSQWKVTEANKYYSLQILYIDQEYLFAPPNISGHAEFLSDVRGPLTPNPEPSHSYVTLSTRNVGRGREDVTLAGQREALTST